MSDLPLVMSAAKRPASLSCIVPLIHAAKRLDLLQRGIKEPQLQTEDFSSQRYSFQIPTLAKSVIPVRASTLEYHVDM